MAASTRKGRSSSSSNRNGGGGKAGKGGGAQTTTDHDEIRQWAEARGGKPSCVRGTGGGGDTGLLRIDFPGYSGADTLQEISWDEFFEKFDQQKLALLYQERTAGGEQSNFNKLVRRTSGSSSRSGGGGNGRKGSGRSASSKSASSSSRGPSAAKSKAKSASKGRASGAKKAAASRGGKAKASGSRARGGR